MAALSRNSFQVVDSFHPSAQAPVVRPQRRLAGAAAPRLATSRPAWRGWPPAASCHSHLAPVIFVFGHRPSHEAKCLSLANLLMSVPTSLAITSAVVTSMPSMRVRCTPHSSMAIRAAITI